MERKQPKSPVELMKERLHCLPDKDIKFAEKFIANRDFDALQDLINSDVYLAERTAKLNIEDSRYSNLNIEMLNELKGIIDEYCILLYPEVEYAYDDYEESDESEEDTLW